jgi:hypothetical protein
MVHPDITKALELVTKRAGRAHAEKVFSHLLGTPTPAKALNAGTQSEVLDHNMGNGAPTETPPVNPGMMLEPDGDEDMHSHDMGPDNEPGEDTGRDPMRILGVARTAPRSMPTAPDAVHSSAPIMSAKELPRNKGGWPKGKSRKGK